MLGVTVLHSTFDACASLVGASCPVSPGQAVTLYLAQSLDFKGCISGVTATAEAKTFDEKNKQISCVDLDVLVN